VGEDEGGGGKKGCKLGAPLSNTFDSRKHRHSTIDAGIGGTRAAFERDAGRAHQGREKATRRLKSPAGTEKSRGLKKKGARNPVVEKQKLNNNKLRGGEHTECP